MTRLVDTATSADWQFLLDPHDGYEEWRRGMVEELWGDDETSIEWHPSPETMEAIRRRTDKVSTKYEVSGEDLFTDTVLHLSVRPHRLDMSDARDAISVISHRAEQVAKNLAQPIASRQAREESLENILAGGMDEWAA